MRTCALSLSLARSQGDGQSKTLVNAWLGSPVAKGVFKDRLDESMAGSIFDSERRLAQMAVDQYTQLKSYKARLQWGFKILDKDVMAKEQAGEIEEQKIVPVSKSMGERACPRGCRDTHGALGFYVYTHAASRRPLLLAAGHSCSDPHLWNCTLPPRTRRRRSQERQRHGAGPVSV